MEEQYRIKRTIWGVRNHRNPEVFLKGTYTKAEFIKTIYDKIEIARRQQLLQSATWDSETKCILSLYQDGDIGFCAKTYELVPLND